MGRELTDCVKLAGDVLVPKGELSVGQQSVHTRRCVTGIQYVDAERQRNALLSFSRTWHLFIGSLKVQRLQRRPKNARIVGTYLHTRPID